MIQLQKLGHILLRVADIERAKAFYTQLLGLEIVEEDPDHGGVFMTLGGNSHTIDLMSADNPERDARPLANRVGVHHVAFQVESPEALREAYFTLESHGVEGLRAVDHVSQQSIYFNDPDGNRLEIYYELPNAPELFRQGRGDRDEPLVFTR